ncbi:2-dehydro-3-deoxyphosphogluconate aldolase/(4S)-4-hydroxy-2-oxoglutarate aldolase [Cytobacillus oceanisediminis]|uniref:2-dehydro-3-deoxyphosphogluconate aldolase/(4S)-4-hydroxy-2-oxoglutarate aldolase n=1 Tax=Cytobacillus oceanisediminis TaxID=665099 RepID=A0A2V2ZV38_9BACI|nr:bifunctional 4-hydroxy-2-oxoglutarate aldolase/2-dehydro-3-deoxy-phosphogluconate aldolase [Cytobacillus oceanisediminis]PWW28262.1 2-dehydro-3-deoxyphosphogluconate aldolase/(4S)-4-hydroxy-2-oxoglutarate aldolase [Cytobacillus oceanisediminis]
MTLEAIKQHKIISIIRGVPGEFIPQIFDALYEGGIRLVELTLNTDNALDLIADMSKRYGGKLLIGAGTVKDEENARLAIDAGAKFILTPILDIPTIHAVKERGAVCITGALSPTEIYTAFTHGSDLVKVFPAGPMGAGYIKDLKGPMPQIPLVPTGGIDVTNASSYLQVGAVALGIGSSLVPAKEQYSSADIAEIKAKAGQFLKLRDGSSASSFSRKNIFSFRLFSKS